MRGKRTKLFKLLSFLNIFFMLNISAGAKAVGTKAA
jgi:hypothetical protein